MLEFIIEEELQPGKFDFIESYGLDLSPVFENVLLGQEIHERLKVGKVKPRGFPLDIAKNTLDSCFIKIGKRTELDEIGNLISISKEDAIHEMEWGCYRVDDYMVFAKDSEATSLKVGEIRQQLKLAKLKPTDYSEDLEKILLHLEKLKSEKIKTRVLIYLT